MTLMKPISRWFIFEVWSVSPLTWFSFCLPKLWACKIIQALPSGVSSPELLGDGDSPDIFLLKLMAELPFQSFSPPTPTIFVFCSQHNLVRIVLCNLNRGGKAVRFYFVRSPTTHLKNFEHFILFEASTLRFIYTYKNMYVKVVVVESIWLLFFDRTVTRGSILSSFIESCGSNSSQP